MTYIVSLIIAAGEEIDVKVIAWNKESARRIIRERYPNGHIIHVEKVESVKPA